MLLGDKVQSTFVPACLNSECSVTVNTHAMLYRNGKRVFGVAATNNIFIASLLATNENRKKELKK